MSKILVIDDDVSILEGITLALELEDYEVSITTKGDEVYKKVTENNPDLIILDILLSGKDGRHICKRLKSQKRTSQIPVIMISAHPSAEDTVKECGADAFLPKPFQLDSLLKLVKMYLPS